MYMYIHVHVDTFYMYDICNENGTQRVSDAARGESGTRNQCGTLTYHTAYKAGGSIIYSIALFIHWCVITSHVNTQEVTLMIHVHVHVHVGIVSKLFITKGTCTCTLHINSGHICCTCMHMYMYMYSVQKHVQPKS